MKQISLKNLALEKKCSFISDYSIDSDILLITFGSMGFKPGVTPFGLMRSTLELPVKKLYIRDFNRAWYHQGFSGRDGNLLDGKY